MNLRDSFRLRALAAALSALVLALAALWAAPPALVRIGAAYAAKIVCSNVFLAGRDPAEVLRVDVQAPANPLLRLVRVSVDRERGEVRAGLFGFIGGGYAVVRPHAGCTLLPAAAANASKASGSIARAAPAAGLEDAREWPDGEAVTTDAALDRLIADDALTGAGMRAIVVVANGRIVAERYARGFDAATPLIGWSMTKTVTAGLIGLLVGDGRLRLDEPAGFAAWRADGRSRITVANLLSMTSGLHFNEEYDGVSDVTRMLFLEPDMAAFALAQPLEHPPGVDWHYSSGTTMILARLFQDRVGPGALGYARTRLFDVLGMRHATLETDASGTIAGASYLYASARDWARYGWLLEQGGIWHGRVVLPPDYVARMSLPVTASGGQYAQGQLWRWGSDPLRPGVNPDAAYGIAPDVFWMEGHDGQYVAVIPSRALVVVRMGLTPDSAHYHPQPLVAAVQHALDAADQR